MLRPAAKGIGSGDRRGLLARVHTFDSLKERSYRWLWLGMLGAFAGMQMQMLARGWLVVDKLDGSALDLGIVTSSSGVPLLLLSLFGGVISDRFPKRNLLVVTQTCNAIIALLVAVLIVTDLVQIWHMIVAAVLTGTVFAFNMPGRQSLIPELVSKDKLSNAIALNAAGMNLNRIIAPGVGGVLVAFIGLSGVYFIVVGCYAFAAFTMLMVHPVRRTMQARTTSIIQDLKAGLKYARSDSKIMSLLLLALVPLIFAHPYQALLPVFAKDILGVGSDGLGFLMGAVGVGAVTGTLALASLSNFRSRGVLMVRVIGAIGAGVSAVLPVWEPVPVHGGALPGGCRQHGIQRFEPHASSDDDDTRDARPGHEHLHDELRHHAPGCVPDDCRRRRHWAAECPDHWRSRTHIDYPAAGVVEASDPVTEVTDQSSRSSSS